VEREGAGDLEPSAATIATMATSTPAAWRLRIRIRWVVARAGLLRVTPPVKAAWCTPEHVDLSLLAEEATETLLPLAQQRGITIETSGDKPPPSAHPRCCCR